MTGSLAQIIALIAMGNEHLHSEENKKISIQHPTFDICETIDFRERREYRHQNDVIAYSPAEWFAVLKASGCEKLRLYYPPVNPANHSSRGNSSQTLIEAIYKEHSLLWSNEWILERLSKTKPWSVHYYEEAAKQPVYNQQSPIDKTTEELREILKLIGDFAGQQALDNWKNIFDNARSMLDQDNPRQHLVSDRQYDLRHRQLLSAANSAFVFGGMGSWNDNWFETSEDQKQYQHLSGALYHTIMKAIVCSVNGDIIEFSK